MNSPRPDHGRLRPAVLLVLGLVALTCALLVPSLAGAQGPEDPPVVDPSEPDVGDGEGDEGEESDPTDPDDSEDDGEGDDERVSALGVEDHSTLDGDGFFGPLFKEPSDFIQPGRALDPSDPTEARVAMSPSECKVVEGEDRTLAQRSADPENDGFINCKVPAASISVTPFEDKLVSWNAVDSTENNDTSIVFEYGVRSIADRSRVFEIERGADEGGNFKKPNPEDGGANPEPEGDPDTNPLIPDTRDKNAQNDGGLFCADHTFLPDGRVMAVGGTNYYNDPGAKDNPKTPVREDNFGPIELQGIRNARIFNPKTDNWTQADRMNNGRWYPTLVTLGNGDTFVASGVNKLIKPLYTDTPPPTEPFIDDPVMRPEGPDADESGRNETTVETLARPDAQWKEAGDPDRNGPEQDKAERSLPLFARLHLLPNGHIFYNASGQSFNPFGQAFDQNLWNQFASYDPDEEKWKDEGVPGITDFRPDDVPRDPGFRGSTQSTMLTLKPNDKGKYKEVELLTGGGIPSQAAPSPGAYFPRNSSRITRVEVDGDKIDTETFNTGQMRNRSPAPDPDGEPDSDNSKPDPKAAPDAPAGTGRWYGSTTVLPTGQVISFAGADRDEVAFPGVEKAIKEIEIFEPGKDDPDTAKEEEGYWRTAASAERRRTYHNTSALLPDGRVLLAGHATISTGYGSNTEVADRGPNGHDPTHEIYTPPNLDPEVLEDNPRPEIEKAPECLDDGEDSFDLEVDDKGSEIQSVVAVRNTSQTHVVDADQRNVELSFTEGDDGELEVEVPNQNVLPPGPYLLFVNASKGDTTEEEAGRGKDDGGDESVEAEAEPEESKDSDAVTVHSEGAQTFIRACAFKGDDDKDDDNGNGNGDGNDNDDDGSADDSFGFGVAGATASNVKCLPAGLRANGRGIGFLRLGMNRMQSILAAGMPATVAPRAFRYCVQGGGRTYLSFSSRGVVQMVASVAAQAGPKGTVRGETLASLRRRYSNLRPLGKKQYVASLPGGGAVAFGVKDGRVRYVAVVDSRLASNLNLLRYYLRGVRLQ